jgi:hypothetical protein
VHRCGAFALEVVSAHLTVLPVVRFRHGSCAQRTQNHRVAIPGFATALQSLSAKVTLAGGLFGLSLVAYAAYKVNDILTRKYLVFLLLMLGLVMLVAVLLLGLRPIFERFMNAAFDKLGFKETIDFKWTSGPVVRKTREVHDLSELPPEIANNPDAEKLLQGDSVKKLFEKTTTGGRTPE